MSHNFALIDVPVSGAFPIVFSLKLIMSAIQTGTFVGLKSISIPEMTIETREVKEGNWPFPHKVLTGFTTTGECVLSQAVMPTHFDMYLWFKQGIWGRIAPRRSFLIVHLKQDKRIPQRMLLLEDCLPLSWKPSSDLDGQTAEVVVEELTLDVHTLSMIPVPIPVGSPNQGSAPRPSA
jgi:phage tail-like protein